MENASHSILIAGTIIIVVALVSLGMLVYNHSQRVIQDTDPQFEMMSTEIHNNMFRDYAGTNLDYAKVKEIVSAVASNNALVGENDTTGNKVVLTVATYTTVLDEQNKNFAIDYANEDITFFIDDAYESLTKSDYLKKGSVYSKRGYDCYYVIDTPRVNKVEKVGQQGVRSVGKGIINEIIIVAKKY